MDKVIPTRKPEYIKDTLEHFFMDEYGNVDARVITLANKAAAIEEWDTDDQLKRFKSSLQIQLFKKQQREWYGGGTPQCAGDHA